MPKQRPMHSSREAAFMLTTRGQAVAECGDLRTEFI